MADYICPCTGTDPIAVLSPPSYNTKNLLPRVSSDLASAFCASTLVAPIICLIDQSIIIRTASSDSISQIFKTHLQKALRRPWVFLTSKPYLLINALYFATYTAANLSDTAVSTAYNKSAAKVTPGSLKFGATSAANISICLYKDAQFAKLFGGGSGGSKSAAKRIVPKASLALFAVRDSMTILASFNLPAYLAPMLGSQHAAQFLAPAAIQLFSTPLHLFGLDLFNRPQGQAKTPVFAERLAMVRRDWLGASFARMGRIIPAYGVGGVINTKIRRQLMAGLD